MSNDFYNPSGWPGTGVAGASAPGRAELVAIGAGFDKMPTFSGNGGKVIRVNALATALEATATLSLTDLTLTGTLTVNGNTILGDAATDTVTFGAGAILLGEAANVLALRNSTTAQALRIYNTFTDASNYERGTAFWTSNRFQVGTAAAGTGTNRPLDLMTAGTARWTVDTSGHFVAFVDNTYDIGATGATRPRSMYWGTQALGPDGTVSNPSFAFAGDPDTGVMWSGTANTFDLSAGGGPRFRISAAITGVTVASGLPLSWGSGGATNGVGTPDLFLFRDAANVLALRNSTTAQVARIYNTFTDLSNYERVVIGAGIFGANSLGVATDSLGTGTARNLVVGTLNNASFNITTNNTSRISVNGAGNMLWSTDNTLDIGATGATRPRSMYWGTQLLGPDGSNAAPSFSFASATTTGMYNSAGQIRYASAGTFCFYMQAAEAGIPSDTAVFTMGSSQDVKLFRDAAAVLALRNSTTAQALRIYNTFTDASNYERLNIEWSSNAAKIFTSALGTGTNRSLQLGAAGAIQWVITTTGHFTANADNTNDIGASGATRPRTIYVGTSFIGSVLDSGAASTLALRTNTGTGQVDILHTASATNRITLTGSNGGNPTISTTGGSLAITPSLALAGDLTIAGASMPQNSQSAAYTTVAADANKHILHPTADNNARTFTIDSNANVAYVIGTCITFVNQINTVTIAITSDTMTLAGVGTTGSRSLAANGVATAVKVAATSWIISGTGLV